MKTPAMISHQRAVLELIERLAKVDSSEQSDATIKIIDELGGRYLLFNNTWKDGRRYYGCFSHLDLSADGKIWILTCTRLPRTRQLRRNPN